MIIKAKEYLRRGDFSQWDQEKLALGIIKDTRRKYNLVEWTKEMTELTGFNGEEVNLSMFSSISSLSLGQFGYE